ncbi:hypothetical protein B6S44_01380 [Bosea sp. Tri-44]|nr:hypothetical protein B6S44_01380 [Bosea sp. Tri-44]
MRRRAGQAAQFDGWPQTSRRGPFRTLTGSASGRTGFGRASSRQRTIPALWDAVGSIVDLFTPTECDNFFKAAGYEPD